MEADPESFQRALEDLARRDLLSRRIFTELGLIAGALPVPQPPPPVEQPPPGTRPPDIRPVPVEPIPDPRPGQPPETRPPRPAPPQPPRPVPPAPPPSPLEQVRRIGPRLFGRFLFGLGGLLFPEPVGRGELFPPDEAARRSEEEIARREAERRAEEERIQERRREAERAARQAEQPAARSQPREEIVIRAPRPRPLTLPQLAPVIGIPFVPFFFPPGSPSAAPRTSPVPGARPTPSPAPSPAPIVQPAPSPGPIIQPGTPPVISPGTPPVIGLQPGPVPGGALPSPRVGRLELPRQRPSARQRERCKEVKRKRRRGRCFEGFYAERFRSTQFTEWREVDCFTGQRLDAPLAEIFQLPQPEGDI